MTWLFRTREVQLQSREMFLLSQFNPSFTPTELSKMGLLKKLSQFKILPAIYRIISLQTFQTGRYIDCTRYFMTYKATGVKSKRRQAIADRVKMKGDRRLSGKRLRTCYNHSICCCSELIKAMFCSAQLRFLMVRDQLAKYHRQPSSRRYQFCD